MKMRRFILFLSLITLISLITVKGHERKKREILKEDDPLLIADLFEGDIAGVDVQTLNNVVNGTTFWTDKVIPYLIDNTIGYVGNRAIKKAMAEIESKTCIKFRNATETDQDIVLFVVSKGYYCYSYIGKQGGKQEISIGDGCEQVGTVLHLLMHLLGFWHEESRIDRDLYILINWDNIAEENAQYFEKYTIPRINVQTATDASSSAYDYESITHISPYAYAKTKSIPTILTKDERFKIGQRLELSQNDVNAIVRNYCGQKQAGPMADLRSRQEKDLYEKIIQEQSGNQVEGQQLQLVGSDEDTPLIEPDQPEFHEKAFYRR